MSLIEHLDNYLELITYGFTNPMPDSNEGPWKITAKDVINGKINYDTARKTTIDSFENDLTPKSKPKINDILLTKDGTLGRLAIVDQENICVNQSVAVLRPNKKIIPQFLYYLLSSPYYQKTMLNDSDGSVLKHIYITRVKKMDVQIPDLTHQKKIIQILELIDNKIDVLIKLNKNLEKTLITIFNSWFINFENYDNSKGMKIDDSYGEIPVDWSVEMLEDYVDFVTGVEPGSKNYHEKPEPNDIPFLRVGDLGSRDNGVFIDPSLSKNKILKYDDIVLSLDATIGIVKMGLEGAYSTGMRKLVIKNDNINQPFLYCLVKSNRIQRIIETFATGTTMLHAGKSIKHMNFVLSDKKTMDDFGKIGNPIISIILTNLKEIEYLTNLRDTLLPKLMSGKIDVSKINCDLE